MARPVVVIERLVRRQPALDEPVPRASEDDGVAQAYVRKREMDVSMRSVNLWRGVDGRSDTPSGSSAALPCSSGAASIAMTVSNPIKGSNGRRTVGEIDGSSQQCLGGIVGTRDDERLTEHIDVKVDAAVLF